MRENGYKGDPIDVVEMDDAFVTLDHTRPAVAREQGIESIPARVHSPDEALPQDMIRNQRFGAESKTWGDAAAHRAGKQTPPLPPNGTSTPPKLPALKGS